MKISKQTHIIPVVLAFLVFLAIGSWVILNMSQPKTGVDAFILHCTDPDPKSVQCHSLDGVQSAFRFDLMESIDETYTKMKNTAQDIAQGRLTDEAYNDCLQKKTCAAVPMLSRQDKEDSPEARQISKVFWQLADGHRITQDICASIPACALALKNNILTFKKNRLIPVQAQKP